MQTKDLALVLGIVVCTLSSIILIAGTGFVVGKAVYGSQIVVETVVHNNTIYRNITKYQECNSTVIVREIIREIPQTTMTIPTTTTTLVFYKSSAPMFGLYNRNQTETHDEKCYLNYSVNYHSKFISGTTYAYDQFDCDELKTYIYGNVEDWTETKGVSRRVISAEVVWSNKTKEKVYP